MRYNLRMSDPGVSSRFISECAQRGIPVRHDELLSSHCSFKTGGPARYFCIPPDAERMKQLLRICRECGMRFIVLGGGTNVLAPDEGLPCAVISTAMLAGISGLVDTKKDSGNIARIGAGASVRRAAALLANAGKDALAFLYGMPGTMGGALWMNARCYGREIADVLVRARGFTASGEDWSYEYDQKDFAYKKSPFQSAGAVITECEIRTQDASPAVLWQTMLQNEFDRRAKGHYSAPCAGSVFKNDRAHGSPAGVLLDNLGFKGYMHRGAKVSERHANIIFNAGGGSSEDIFELSDLMKSAAEEKLGLTLEREIILLACPE